MCSPDRASCVRLPVLIGESVIVLVEGHRKGKLQRREGDGEASKRKRSSVSSVCLSVRGRA